MAAGKVIIYGGRGALGSAIASHFKAKGWWVGSIDLVSNDNADFCITVPRDASWSEQAQSVLSGLEKVLADGKVDAIINVAGGWAGGNAAHKDFLKSCEMMWQQSVWSSTISAQAASSFLKEGGLLTLPGAFPAVNGTPGMIGYGLAKAAVHQLTKSLGEEKSGLPKGSTALCILPTTLDTPMNRKWMSGADTTTWTSLEFVSDLFYKWANGQERPKTGSLVQLITKDGKTELVMA
ncbi:dihydropteridine reductase [Oratosquilla oratoria]|uniref:dihydropteridine reductase n=1 Tax=Oratosquilla oratoria TaxID=337810 RepID=UPI003F770320